LPESKCRELFPNDHGGGTFRTTEDGWLGGGRDRRRPVGLGIMLQQLLTKRKKLGSAAIGEESERADTNEARRQNGQQESP